MHENIHLELGGERKGCITSHFRALKMHAKELF